MPELHIIVKRVLKRACAHNEILSFDEIKSRAREDSGYSSNLGDDVEYACTLLPQVTTRGGEAWWGDRPVGGVKRKLAQPKKEAPKKSPKKSPAKTPSPKFTPVVKEEESSSSEEEDDSSSDEEEPPKKAKKASPKASPKTSPKAAPKKAAPKASSKPSPALSSKRKRDGAGSVSDLKEALKAALEAEDFDECGRLKKAIKSAERAEAAKADACSGSKVAELKAQMKAAVEVS